jgi:hypothetical protein
MSGTIAERAAAGAVFLDERLPGWHQRIDLGTLWLMSPCRCVLGQLDGGGDDGLSTPFGRQLAALGLQLRSDEARSLGFDLYDPDGNGEDDDPGAWEDLNDAWAAQVRSRRAGQGRA